MLAIVAVHTAENEPSRRSTATRTAAGATQHTQVMRCDNGVADFPLMGEQRSPVCRVEFIIQGDGMSSYHQTLDGSFSAVWTATIARVGAFFSIFRDLQDLCAFAPLRPQKFT